MSKHVIGGGAAVTNEERIKESAKALLEVLETPIAGVKSVTVNVRKNALRLIEAALTGVFEGVIADMEDEK